jgi:hypothetical protein
MLPAATMKQWPTARPRLAAAVFKVHLAGVRSKLATLNCIMKSAAAALKLFQG